MSGPFLAAVLAFAGVPEELVPPGYPQLPSEQIAACNWWACRQDLEAIDCQLALVGGWQAEQLREVRWETEKTARVWWAAWWAVKSPDSYTWMAYEHDEAPPFADPDEALADLYDRLGADAFWRGELPLPLSLRR